MKKTLIAALICATISNDARAAVALRQMHRWPLATQNLNATLIGARRPDQTPATHEGGLDIERMNSHLGLMFLYDLGRGHANQEANANTETAIVTPRDRRGNGSTRAEMLAFHIPQLLAANEGVDAGGRPRMYAWIPEMRTRTGRIIDVLQPVALRALDQIQRLAGAGYPLINLLIHASPAYAGMNRDIEYLKPQNTPDRTGENDGKDDCLQKLQWVLREAPNDDILAKKLVQMLVDMRLDGLCPEFQNGGPGMYCPNLAQTAIALGETIGALVAVIIIVNVISKVTECTKQRGAQDKEAIYELEDGLNCQEEESSKVGSEQAA
jgi:hypothetical protein